MTKTIKNFIAVFLVTALLIPSAAVMSSAAFAADIWNGTSAAFDEGDGSELSPFLIKTASNLAYLSAMVSSGDNCAGKYFKLETDISLAGNEWMPIGSVASSVEGQSAVFMGDFNGNGHVITGATISYPYYAAYNVGVSGLFGNTNNASIYSLGVEDIDIDVTFADEPEYFTAYAGGLAGISYSKMTDCYSTGSITVKSSARRASVGGLVGIMSFAPDSQEGAGDGYSGEITSCYSSVNVSSITENEIAIAGGLVSQNYNCPVVSSYAVGEVRASGAVTSADSTSSASAGGLAGFSSNGSFTDCYATGKASSVARNACAGGFVGDCRTGSTTLTSCFATGNVSSLTNDCAVSAGGGLVGAVTENEYSIVNSYRSEAQVFAITEATSGDGCNSGSDQFREGSSATNSLGSAAALSSFTSESFVTDTLLWNLEDVWIIDSASSYPYPQLRCSTVDIKVTGISFSAESAELKYGDSITLSPVVAPAIATNKDVAYAVTTGESVAVNESSGKVVTVSVGESIITATTVDGSYTAEISINVLKGDCTIAVPALSVKTDCTVALTAPSSTGDGIVTYGCSTTDDVTSVPQWQESTYFTDLSRNTVYYFFAKVSDGTNYNDAVSSSLEVLTDKSKITGTASISGTAKYGLTLSAEAVLLPEGATFDYQWYNNNVAIDGATAKNYVVAADDIGAGISVKVIGNGSFNGTVSSDSVTPAKAERTISVPVSSGCTDTQIAFNSLVFTGDGTAYYGCSLQNDIDTAKWQADTVFTGLTRNTAYYFFAKVVGGSNYADASSASVSVTTKKTDVGGAVTISGVAEYDATLAANVQIAPDGATFAYQWCRDGIAIENAIDIEYTVTTDDIGASITVKALGVGDYTDSIESTPVVPAKAARSINAPSAVLATDSSVTLSTVTVSGDGDVTYGCSLSSGAESVTDWQTGTEFTGFSRNTSYYFFARVTNGTNYADAVSPATKIDTEKTEIGGSVAISGIAEYLSTLTAADAVTPDGATFTLQWFGNASEIENATDSTYTVTSDDIGAEITVRLTATGDFYGELTSTAVIPGKASRAIDAPEIASKTDSSVTLTEVTATGNGSIVYGAAESDSSESVAQWQTGIEFIGLSRNTTYYFFAKVFGSELYIDAVSASASATTDKTEIFGTVSIDGTAQFGQTLTAAAALSPEDATVAYQWFRDGVKIEGAAAATYTVAFDDIGAEITVTLTATGSFYGEAASDAVVPVKASRSVPAPQMVQRTDSSVTLSAVSPAGDGDVVYGCSLVNSAADIAAWQAELAFTNLNRNTKYYFFAKVSGSTSYADALSAGTAVTTDKTAITGAVSFEGTGERTKALIASAEIFPVGAAFNYQWLRDGVAINGASDASYTVTAEDVGTAITVKAVATGDFSGEVVADTDVTGFEINVTDVALSRSSATVRLGTTLALSATVSPSDATDKSVTWSSSDEAIATVDSSGVITARARGAAVITVTTTDSGKTSTCTITVFAPVTSISIPDSLTVTYKGTGKIDATISPDSSTVKSVTWSSSNAKIVSVDGNGNVRAAGRGSATITATVTDIDGVTYTDTCKVNVKVLWWQWIIIIVLFGFIWY